jgi:hypothetical protein
MSSPVLRVFVTAALGLALLVPALAQEESRLATLPWDDQIDQSVRSGISTALWKETDKLQAERNDAGEKYIRVFTNSGVEYYEGKPTSFVTIQRCLEDKMITELWRYSFEEQGKDYEIVNREKLLEDDTARYTYYESGDSSRPTQPFTFEHDLLTLKVDAGRAALGFLGDDVTMVGIEASGRLTVEPLNDHEKQFFVRQFDAPRLDTAIEAVGITMDPRNQTFLQKAGLTGAGEQEPTGPPAGDGVTEMFDQVTEMLEDKDRYSPYFYDWLPPEQQKDQFALRIKTTDHGWVTYAYGPNDPQSTRAIVLMAEDRRGYKMMGLRQKIVSIYHEPEVRKLDPIVKESKPAFRFTAPHRYDAMFDISAGNFVAEMDIDLLIMEHTDVLTFGLAGNPTVRSVRTVDGDPLMTVPILSAASTKYGFEETANTFRVMLPRGYEKGEKLRLRLSFESPKMVDKIEESFWTVSRGGFLPFFRIIEDPAHCRFIIRTEEDYEHIALGRKMHEEVVDGYRYTEWGSKHTFNFPTMIIGQYHEPIDMEASGIDVTGYVPKTIMQVSVGNKALRPEVQMAVNAVNIFSRMFQAAYPFEAMKVISAPEQFSWAQAPSSMIYVGQLFLLSDAEVAAWMGANPSEFRGTTVHEVSHQWWGGRVSSINTFHYWWVEGLAEMSTAIYRRIAEGEDKYREKLADWHADAMAAEWTGSLLDFQMHNEGVPVIPLHYTKGPMVFHQLSLYFGRPKMEEFLANLMKAHAGDLISTADVQRVAEETFGVNLQWYFDDWVRQNGVPEVSYRIDEARQAEDGSGWIVTGELEQVVKRKGELVEGRHFQNLLVPINVHPSDGEPYVQPVIMEGPTKRFRFRVESKPRRIKVNEHKEMLIETKRM